MRILMVSQHLPYPKAHDGFRAQTAEFLAHFASEHTVALVAMAPPHAGDAERRWPDRYASPSIVLRREWSPSPLSGGPGVALVQAAEAAVRLIDRFAPDILHLDGPALAPLARLGDLPTVLASPGSPAARARAIRQAAGPLAWPAAWLAERRARRWEQRWFRTADVCVVASDEDRTALERVRAPQDVDVIAPGLDLRRYRFRRAAHGPRIVITGDLRWPPDVATVHRVTTRVFARVRQIRPDVELVIGGGTPARRVRGLDGLPGVRVVAPVSDARLIVAGASVYLAPHPLGLGSRRSLLEAMALGAPVVATRAAVAGLDIVPGSHALVVEHEREMADAVVAVLGEPVVAATLAHNARRLVAERHAWPVVGRAWNAVLARARGGPRGEPVRGAA